MELEEQEPVFLLIHLERNLFFQRAIPLHFLYLGFPFCKVRAGPLQTHKPMPMNIQYGLSLIHI